VAFGEKFPKLASFYSLAKLASFFPRARLASFCLRAKLASFYPLAFLLLAGCDPTAPTRLVVATTWPIEERAELEKSFRSKSPNLPPIEWVSLAVGESLARTIERRGGVDLIVGGPSWELEKLSASGKLEAINPSDLISWQSIGRRKSRLGSFGNGRDPRNNPDWLAQGRSILQAQGWPKGYETLVRQAISGREREPETSPIQMVEGIALVRGGRHPKQAREWIAVLQEKGVVIPTDPQARFEASADSLLADLLGSALVDASRELRDAQAALTQFNHPARAEGSIGERPPWPPASVTRLRESPNGEALVETLLEQIAPERQVRDWLRESWSQPRTPIDGQLLKQIAGALDGRLAAEPRFRAWLRGEWTAWTRQLYRRVARLAGGYLPS
jgi:hypothetical protein